MNSKIIIYQVMPRLFGNTNATNKENGTIQDNGCGKFASFSEKALSEIAKMGVTHIWYTGILEHASQTDYSEYGIQASHPDTVKGIAGSPYAVRDCYDVAPDLAISVPDRLDEWKKLVKRTHDSGMNVIIDFVPNHVARQYHSDAKPRRTKDLGETDLQVRFSHDNNFYYLPHQSLQLPAVTRTGAEAYHEEPAKVSGNDCFCATPQPTDWYDTVKINYGVDYQKDGIKLFTPLPDTWFKMLDILLYWCKTGVDGFRCDMVEMVPVEFWNWVITKVRDRYPNTLFIAEAYTPEQYARFLHFGHFNYLYDKVGLYETLRNIVSESRPSSDITSCWQRLGDLQKNMLNFLENHDEQRIASDFFAKDPQKAIPAVLVSLTMNTNPFMLYAGQELGERGMDKEGFSGIDGRTSIFDYWSPQTLRNWYNEGKFGTARLNAEQKKLRKQYIQLLSLAKEPAVAQGKFYDIMYVNYNNPRFDPTRQYAFFRGNGEELLLIAANFSSQQQTVDLNIPADALHFFGNEAKSFSRAKDLLSSYRIVLPNGVETYITIDLEAHSGRVLKFS